VIYAGKCPKNWVRYTFSYPRLSDQLRLIGIPVSPSTVRCVWAWHGLTLRYHRLLWLERKTAASC
jgi:hypothetical protein